MAELEICPCPFCDCRDIAVVRVTTIVVNRDKTDSDMTDWADVYIRCMVCGASLYSKKIDPNSHIFTKDHIIAPEEKNEIVKEWNESIDEVGPYDPIDDEM